MENKKILAEKLRLEGYSYGEISSQIMVSKSTLSSWLKNLKLPPEACAVLEAKKNQGVVNALVKRNKLQTVLAQERTSEIQEQAKVEVLPLSKNDLLLIGTALYWAEGYKRPIIRDGKEITSHAISFVNSDPHMIRMFIRFLTEVLEVPLLDIRATMRLYEHMNEDLARAYWQKESGLPLECFRTSTYQVSLSSKGVRPFNRLEFGTF